MKITSQNWELEIKQIPEKKLENYAYEVAAELAADLLSSIIEHCKSLPEWKDLPEDIIDFHGKEYPKENEDRLDAIAAITKRLVWPKVKEDIAELLETKQE